MRTDEESEFNPEEWFQNYYKWEVYDATKNYEQEEIVDNPETGKKYKFNFEMFNTGLL